MIFFFVMAALVVTVCCLYNHNLTAVDKKDKAKIEVVIPSGASVKQIGNILKEKDLIHNANFFYFYCKVYEVGNMKATTYELSKSMSLKEIIDSLVEGNSYNPDEISITFQEGINMRKVASIIAKNTNNSEDDVMSLLKDDAYLTEIIDKYWFLTDAIKNDDIYYSLEGYLAPNTYKFKNRNVTVKEIFNKMLDQQLKVLDGYKEQFQKSSYDVHQLFTLASIVELEGKDDKARQGIAAVFYNRLNNKMQLGSDATTYYASRVDMNERDLRESEINEVNAYNTRPAAMAGKLPVGPIANVSESSIKAVLNPTKDSSIFYFVADKDGNIYFTKTYQEHLQKIEYLKDKGVWYEW